MRAKAFYAILAVLMVLGALLNFTPIDPIKALFWSAVINGVVAVPVMVMMMLMATRRTCMGRFVLSTPLRIVGWAATAVMAAATAGMFATWNS